MSNAVFEVTDASSNVIFSNADSLGIIRGFVDINNAVNPTGSISDAGLANGRPFYLTRRGFFDGGTTITFSGATMSWTPLLRKNGTTDTNWAGRVYYGVC